MVLAFVKQLRPPDWGHMVFEDPLTFWQSWTCVCAWCNACMPSAPYHMTTLKYMLTLSCEVVCDVHCGGLCDKLTESVGG